MSNPFVVICLEEKLYNLKCYAFLNCTIWLEKLQVFLIQITEYKNCHIIILFKYLNNILNI